MHYKSISENSKSVLGKILVVLILSVLCSERTNCLLNSTHFLTIMRCYTFDDFSQFSNFVRCQNSPWKQRSFYYTFNTKKVPEKHGSQTENILSNKNCISVLFNGIFIVPQLTLSFHMGLYRCRRNSRRPTSHLARHISDSFLKSRES